MWFDKQTYLQTFSEDFHNLLTTNGWTKALEYRVTDGNAKFIEVKLYEATGSDNELRKFGTVMAYDTANSDFGDNRYISNTSPLGLLGYGDGSIVEFHVKCHPFLLSNFTVYTDGQVVSPSLYTVDSTTGKVTFNTAPAKDVKITCEYQLTKDAHDPSNDMVVFTYNRWTIDKHITPSDSKGNLGNGDGTKVTFSFSVTNIDETRLKLYKNDGLVPATDYTLDPLKGEVTFKTAPASSDKITADYYYFVQIEEGNTIPDIVVGDFDVQDPNVVMGKVYGTVNFHNASPPTNVSFNPERQFTNEWQRDSTMYMYGNVNKDRIIMFMRIDPTGAPIKAYFVPLYIGRLNTLGNKPRKNMVIFSGCRQGDEVTWEKDKMIGMSNVDYGDETSNGNTVAQLQQSYSGAMYQNHYFAFITHDKNVDNGQGRYNPSMYSNKYHLSQIFLVHPNDGYVGKLDDIYAVHPKNIQQADELEIVKTVKNEEVGVGDGTEVVFHLEHQPKAGTLKIKVNCAEVTNYTLNTDLKQLVFNDPPVGEILADYDFAQLYRYTLPTTPVSPCTQDKATPFNPIGLAVYKEELE